MLLANDDDGQLALAVSRSWRAAVPTPARAVTAPDTLLALRCVARVLTADWSLVRADIRLLICPLQWSPAALAADWSLVRADIRLLICPLQWSPAALAALATVDSFA